MPDVEHDDDLSTAWSARFSNVERLDDPEEDATFAVDFAMEGLGANGSLTVLIGDLDEDRIIPQANALLEEALRAWLRAIEQRKGAGPVEATNG